MKKLSFNILLFSLLFHIMSVQGMKRHNEYVTGNDLASIDSMPPDTLQYLTSGLPLTECVKMFMRLSMLSRYYNNLLVPDMISYYCKNYTDGDRFMMFKDLVIKKEQVDVTKKCHHSCGCKPAKEYREKIIHQHLSKCPYLKLPILILAHAGSQWAKAWLIKQACSVDNAEIDCLVRV